MKTKFTLLVIIILLLSCGQRSKKYFKDINTVQDSVIIEEEMIEETIIESSEHASEEYIIEESHEVSGVFSDNNIIVEASTQTQLPNAIIVKPRVNVPKYEMGKLVYNIPSEMIKLETYSVVARISRNLIDITIYEDIVPVVDTTIRTSKTMQVELIDPSGVNFNIISQSATQFIEIDEPTEWVFFVTPLNYGEAKLSIVVSIIKDDNLKQTVYNDDVIVKTTTWLEIKLWFGMYWQWFTVVLLIPLIRWIYNKFSKNEK